MLSSGDFDICLIPGSDIPGKTTAVVVVSHSGYVVSAVSPQEGLADTKPEFLQRTGSYSGSFVLHTPPPASSHHMLFILLYLLHFTNKERKALAVLHPYLNHSHLDLASQVFG